MYVCRADWVCCCTVCLAQGTHAPAVGACFLVNQCARLGRPPALHHMQPLLALPSPPHTPHATNRVDSFTPHPSPHPTPPTSPRVLQAFSFLWRRPWWSVYLHRNIWHRLALPPSPLPLHFAGVRFFEEACVVDRDADQKVYTLRWV